MPVMGAWDASQFLPRSGLPNKTGPAALGFSALALDSAFGVGDLSKSFDQCGVAGARSHLSSVFATAARLRSGASTEVRCLAARNLGSFLRPSFPHAGCVIFDDGRALAVEALSEGLKDAAPEVRWAAAEVLTRLTEQGIAEAEEAFFARCPSHFDAAVRQKVVEAYGRGLKGGCVKALLPFLRDVAAEVRVAAAHTLPKVAMLSPSGDVAAIQAGARLLEDTEDSVRAATADALSLLACPSDDATVSTAATEVVVAEIVQRLVPPRGPCTSVTCLGVLEAVAPVGYLPALTAALECGSDADAVVRQAAVCCMDQLAQQSDARVLAALTRSLADSVATVRQLAAAAVLQRSGTFLTASCIAALLACNDHPSDELLRNAGSASLKVDRDQACKGDTDSWKSKRASDWRGSWMGLYTGPENTSAKQWSHGSLTDARKLLMWAASGNQPTRELKANSLKAEWRERCAAIQLLGKSWAAQYLGSEGLSGALSVLKAEHKDMRARLALDAAAKLINIYLKGEKELREFGHAMPMGGSIVEKQAGGASRGRSAQSGDPMQRDASKIAKSGRDAARHNTSSEGQRRVAVAGGALAIIAVGSGIGGGTAAVGDAPSADAARRSEVTEETEALLIIVIEGLQDGHPRVAAEARQSLAEMAACELSAAEVAAGVGQSPRPWTIQTQNLLRNRRPHLGRPRARHLETRRN